MKIDVIIPVYKAKEKIASTIFSFGELKNYHFIIVNDNDGLDYTFLKDLCPSGDFTFLSTEVNSGPGVARNIGLATTKYKYCIFIDAGDVIFSIHDFQAALKQIKTGTEVIACGYFGEEPDHTTTYTSPVNNLIHGKIYNLAFLKKYNIQFNPNCAFVNEDIGFNFQCRLLSKNWINQDMGLVIQTYDKDSLTRKNNCEFFYNQNIEGLAKNAIFAYQIAFKNGVPMEKIVTFSYEAIIYSYIFYYTTVNQCPEFQSQAFAGAQYFYNNYIKNIEHSLNSPEFARQYNDIMRNMYNNPDDPFLLAVPKLSIFDWLRSLATV